LSVSDEGYSRKAIWLVNKCICQIHILTAHFSDIVANLFENKSNTCSDCNYDLGALKLIIQKSEMFFALAHIWTCK
jgi:hypothetical protein